jgi:hypothetical protein
MIDDLNPKRMAPYQKVGEIVAPLFLERIGFERILEEE